MSSKRRISICRCLTPISDSHAPLSHGISLMFDALGFHRHSLPILAALDFTFPQLTEIIPITCSLQWLHLRDPDSS
jgi:hypothetical protein